MKNLNRETTTALLTTAIFAVLAIWITWELPNLILRITIAIIAAGLGILTFIKNVTVKKRDLAEGSPSEDEFTRIAKVYAGSQAFLYSMYLWFLIFIFQRGFNKTETMLGIGILGSAMMYGVFMWYYKGKGGFNEE
jgi:hypothetical protein